MISHQTETAAKDKPENGIKRKYQLILNHEQDFALSLAAEMIYAPEKPRWMALFPIVYFLHRYRVRNYERKLRDFSQNFLKTKILALDISLEEIRTGDSVELSVEKCFPQVDSSMHKDVRLCEKQLAELMVLKDHYRRLFKPSGNNYLDLLKKAYRKEEDLKQFNSRLARAESEINRYILKNYQKGKWSEPTVRQMENITARLREQNIKGIF